MTIYYKAKDRKALAQAVSDCLGVPAQYMGVPSFSYRIAVFTVTRQGNLEFDDNLHESDSGVVMDYLSENGFTLEETQPETTLLSIEIPISGKSVENLTKLLEAKGRLIRRALAVDKLPIEVTDSTVKFPWFSECGADECKAYTHFVSALCELAANAKRVTAKEKETDNDKYAFRCFLLRLGFIGAEYKAERKILLRNLTGSSAFKNGGAKNEVSE